MKSESHACHPLKGAMREQQRQAMAPPISARSAMPAGGIQSSAALTRRLPRCGPSSHSILRPVRLERLQQGAVLHSSAKPCSPGPSRWQCSASDPSQTPPPVKTEEASSPPGVAEPAGQRNPRSGSRRNSADSTDWIASAVTRRFGIGAGLAWVGFLAFGVISEQLKTRREVYLEESQTRDVEEAAEVVLPSGVRYTDLRIGGGASPLPGDLVIVSLVGKAEGSAEPFIDTTSSGKKDVVFAMGARPYRGGVTEGLVEAIRVMKAGGKRIVRVPPELGFGAEGAKFSEERIVPGGAELEYVVELKRVSIAPS